MSYIPRPDVIWEQLKELKGQVKSLLTQSPLGFTSITRGSLRIASEEGLIVQGSALVVGLLSVLGRVRIHGLGILEVLSLIDLLGSMRVSGGGSIDIEAGGGMYVGQITIADGKIIIGGGSSPATLENGKLSFGTGGAVEADTGVGGVKMTAGDAVVNAGTVASIRKGDSSVIVGASEITINPAGSGDIDMGGTVHLSLGTIPQESGTGLPFNTLLISPGGYLQRSDGT